MSTTNVAHYEEETVVGRYEALREEGLFDRERRAIESYFAPGSRILDLGCGAGRTTMALAERGFSVVGVDASRPMIDSARRAHPDGEYVVGDAANLPFRDADFENVLFSYNGLDVLRPQSLRYEALREIRRVLVPGGRFVFTTHNLLRQLVPYPLSIEHLRALAAFWWSNLRQGLVGTPYKRPPNEQNPGVIYYTDFVRQVMELDRCGLDFVTMLERDSLGSKYFGPALFFVAERPAEKATGAA